MFVRLSKFLMVLALVATVGLNWGLLQTIAWTTMLANNLESHSFSTAVSRTFDGKHPCCLCKAIAAAKSKQKKEVAGQIQKFEFPPAKKNFVLIPPSRFELLPQKNFFAESFSQKPLVPPPRGFFV